jgi:hypothetical protein
MAATEKTFLSLQRKKPFYRCNGKKVFIVATEKRFLSLQRKIN